MSALQIAGAFVRAHESCRLAAYADSGGVWTIGWGHAGEGVHAGLIWTQAQADAQLTADLTAAFDAVIQLTKIPLADCQIAALISFVFNLGEGALANSTLLTLINAREFLSAAKEFLRFDHAGGSESKGLLIRRLDEAALFLK